MLNRRLFLGGLSASLPLALMPGVGRAQAQAGPPRLLAMIVGINTYTGLDANGRRIRPLLGCLNDAADIEQHVQRLQPAFLRRLGWDAPAGRERAVTRADFLGTWREMMAVARPGDTVLLTFSGHGSQIPVLPGNPSGETDGMDETLVLTHYSVRDGRNAEHIIDDELDELIRDAHRRGVIVVLVSDSCHSGTVYRTIERRDKSYRTLNPDLSPRGPLARPVPPSEPLPEAPPNLLFLGGSQENELVSELAIGPGGQPRGALSMAVAEALQGRAADGGVITAYGLARYVLRRVRDLSDSAQHPDVILPAPMRLSSVGSARPTPSSVLGVTPSMPLIVTHGGPGPAVAARHAATGPVRLLILGRSEAEQRAFIASLRHAVLAASPETASLIWDAERRLILNEQGSTVAEDVDAGQVQDAVDRRLALDRLTAMSADAGLDVRILLDGRETPASDATHTPGTRLEVTIGGIEDGSSYCLFNLTGNGKVEMLEPYPGEPPSFERAAFRSGARKDRGGGEIAVGGVVVKPQGPFGAEHVVAVAGALPLGRLMPALAEAHNRFAVPAVMAALAAELQAQPLKVGFRGIYSGRG